jgi:uncharacterized membrane protein HdeD (DUF308 family)
METGRYKNWGLLAVNGIVAILFGCLMLFFTREVIQTIVFYFGLVIAIGGAILALVSFRNIQKDKGTALILVESILMIAIGCVVMFTPQQSLNFFLVLVGIWLIIIGIAQLIVLMNVGTSLGSRNILLVNSLLTLSIGVLLIFHPFAVATWTGKIIGLVSILFGALMIYLSLQLRLMKKTSAEGNP